MMALLICVMSLSESVAETEVNQRANASVADDIEIHVMPNGDVVTRLVSRSGVTAQKWWVDSVYGSRERILIFQGNGGSLESTTAVPVVPGHEIQLDTNQKR